MDVRNFIDVVLKTHVGCIIVVNMLDGLKLSLHDEKFIRTVFKEWFQAFAKVNRNYDEETIANSLELALLNGKSSKSPNNRFFLKYKSSVKQKAKFYLTVMPFEYIRSKIWKLDLPDLFGSQSAVIDYENDESDRIRLIKNIEVHLTESLGKKDGVLWFTTDSSLQKESGSTSDGNSIRDCLGLIHYPKKGKAVQELVILQFPTDRINPNETARPTFADAGGHKRFKVLSDTKNEDDLEWGITVNLKKFLLGEANVDGCYERVSYPVHPKKLGKIQIKPLSDVSIVRGNTEQDNNKAFANLLVRRHTNEDELNEDKLRKNLIKVLIDT